MTGPATSEAYLEAQTADARERLRTLVALVQEVFPGARPIVSYQMLGFADRRPEVHLGAWKKHLGVYALGVEAQADPEAAPYLQEKGTLQFGHDQPLPVALIRRLLVANTRGRGA